MGHRHVDIHVRGRQCDAFGVRRCTDPPRRALRSLPAGSEEKDRERQTETDIDGAALRVDLLVALSRPHASPITPALSDRGAESIQLPTRCCISPPAAANLA